MPKYLSGRVKRTPQDKLTEDRYQYLGLDQAEPNLGDPPETDPIPSGTQYQIVSLPQYPGVRYWKEIGGGVIPASHTVRDEGFVVPRTGTNPNLGINSITDVNFAGAAVTVTGFLNPDGSPGTAVTVTVAPPGEDHGVLFNNEDEFATSSFFTFDNSIGIGSVGIGTSTPSQNLHVAGDVKLDKTIYGEDNQPGNTGDLLVKTATGGMKWTDQNAVRSGAGVTIGQIQFHDSTGLVGGASTFYYDYVNHRVGIGSTIPDRLLDVRGNSRFVGFTTFTNDVDFPTANGNDILFDRSDDSLIFGDNVNAKFGSDKDASIYHDDTNFYIDNGEGNIFLRVGVKTSFKAIPDEGVELYFNNSKRFETTNTGIAITGTNSTIHGKVGIQSHLTLPNDAQIRLGTNSNLVLESEADGDILIKENSSGNFNILGSNIIFKNSQDTKKYAEFKNGESVNLFYDNSQKFQTTGVGVSVSGLTTTTDLAVSGVVTSHLVPSIDNNYDLGSIDNAWRNIYAQKVISVIDAEFQFLNVTGILTTKDLHVSGISSFVGVATFHDDVIVGSALSVTGISTFNDDITIGTGATVGIGSTVFFGDDVKAVFGNDKVLEIYHGNSPYNPSTPDQHSYIRDKGPGDLVVLSNQFSIRNAAETKDMARFYENDRVELRYDNNLVFQTTGAGVSVTGLTSTTNLYVAGVSTFNGDIKTEFNSQYDIGAKSVGFRTVYAKEFVGKISTTQQDLILQNLNVNGVSTFVGLATFNDGINVMSGITTVGFLTVRDDIFVAGVVTATDFNSTSDIKLKTNIQVIDNPIDKIMKINGVSFNWKVTNKPSFGVIADNVQEILPDLVNDEDPKTVNYNGLVGLLIEVVKNQQEQINELRGLLDK